MVTNVEFLRALFGEEFIWAHVTAHGGDPSKGGAACVWKGDHFINYGLRLQPGVNQYFCVSLFNSDGGPARRRKELFQACYCIVIDDVKEKISGDCLPWPSWILETSAGSEQWGYILSEACTDQRLVAGLLDGIIREVCPGGVDSGMAGVTRYVRLPEGSNLKHGKRDRAIGEFFKCRLKLWQPDVKFALLGLAEHFGVDLIGMDRGNWCESEVGVRALDHPVFKCVEVNRECEPGRYDVRCPWIAEHTGGVNDGAMLFIRANGSLGFKCHHGHCSKRDGRYFLAWLHENDSTFIMRYMDYLVKCRRKDLMKSGKIAIPKISVYEKYNLNDLPF